MSDPQISKLGNYRIVRLIGRGGFANVYLGKHIYLKIPAAIKVLNIQLADDTLESFLNEAQIVALLEHPRIVRVLEFGVEDGVTPFLVMNYAENGTLRQLYPRKSILPWGSILSYTRQVAEALQYAHDHGVIHRDVKPENMLLGKNKHIQLSDFGLALLVQGKPHSSRSAGTTVYMAPEQLQGNPCKASDQYALGAVIYEWLCGSPPFTGSEREITIQQLYAPPPPILTRAQGVSPAVEQVIMKALAKDPAARFASISEFAQVLEDVASSESLLNTGTQRTTSPALPDISSLWQQKQADVVSPEEASSSHSTRPQGPVEIPAASHLLPQLPLLVYESPLTNNKRILRPSSYSLGEHSSLPTILSSQDDAFQISHVSLSLSMPDTMQSFSSLPSSSSHPTLRNTSKPDTVLPQTYTMSRRRSHPLRRLLLIALVGILLVGLIILAGIGIQAVFLHTPQKVSSYLPGSSSVTAVATAIVHTQPSQRTVPSPGTHHSTMNIPVVATSPTTASPTGVPVGGITPTPLATSAPPAPTATLPPTAVSTQVVALTTVAIISAPDSAVAGSTISVVVQANKGGVTIALNGIVRSFGSQVADSQGIATFVITAPLLGKRMVLTATAIDTNGDQVDSAKKVILIT